MICELKHCRNLAKIRFYDLEICLTHYKQLSEAVKQLESADLNFDKCRICQRRPAIAWFAGSDVCGSCYKVLKREVMRMHRCDLRSARQKRAE